MTCVKEREVERDREKIVTGERGQIERVWKKGERKRKREGRSVKGERVESG